MFGMTLLTSTHLYWGEMQFKSYLIQFRGEGTYTESKLFVGMSITDSTRSENTIVRTSYSRWLLTTQIISSTQAKPEANSFSDKHNIQSFYAINDAAVSLEKLTEQQKKELPNEDDSD